MWGHRHIPHGICLIVTILRQQRSTECHFSYNEFLIGASKSVASAVMATVGVAVADAAAVCDSRVT